MERTYAKHENDITTGYECYLPLTYFMSELITKNILHENIIILCR